MPASMQQHSAGTREQIAKNAYELYEQQGRQDEQDLDDRLQVMRALHETGE